MLKIKFNTFEEVKDFITLVLGYESDFFFHSNKYVVDATSLLGIFSLDLTKTLDLEVIEKKEGEIASLKEELEKLNILA